MFCGLRLYDFYWTDWQAAMSPFGTLYSYILPTAFLWDFICLNRGLEPTYCRPPSRREWRRVYLPACVALWRQFRFFPAPPPLCWCLCVRHVSSFVSLTRHLPRLTSSLPFPSLRTLYSPSLAFFFERWSETIDQWAEKLLSPLFLQILIRRLAPLPLSAQCGGFYAWGTYVAVYVTVGECAFRGINDFIGGYLMVSSIKKRIWIGEWMRTRESVAPCPASHFFWKFWGDRRGLGTCRCFFRGASRLFWHVSHTESKRNLNR